MDVSALRSVMRFLLPPSRISLRSNCLLSLLCLDWLNEKFCLELELEPSWISGLTSSNITVFLCGCFNFSADDEVEVAEVEALVVLAMEAAEMNREQKTLGRDRFQQIVTKVLDSDSEVDWISKYRSDVRSVLDSFPRADFLEKALRKNDKVRGDWSYPDTTGFQSVPEEEVTYPIRYMISTN